MTTVSNNKKKKGLALAAAGVVLVAGATVTSLAAWTDTEWIWGAGEGAPGVGTSSFEVQQNVTADADSWTDEETGPGQQINFGVEANSLTPGTTHYAFVRLQTTVGSDAGSLTLNAAAASDATDAALYDALEYEARLMDEAATCSAGDFAGTGTSLIAAGSPLSTGSTTEFTLAGDAAQEQTACFALTLPADESANGGLQGLTATPVWNFAAISQ